MPRTHARRIGGELDVKRGRFVGGVVHVLPDGFVREACDFDAINMDIIYNQSYNVSMKSVAAAKFKEQCLSMLDHLEPEGLVITKHGKPVARLLPIARASADLIGLLRGRIRVKGDIMSTGVKWEAGD
jgi:antitoxin (DNA-binding transcriptional repressor) of toxin-antitoxin stability system